MKITVCVSFIFLFTFQPYIVTSQPRYEPIDNIALDCGSQGNQTAYDTRSWIGDNNRDDRFTLIEQENNVKSSSLRALYQQSSVEQVPYMTARISRSEFTYSFRLSEPGPKFVRIHFYPGQYEQGFDVSESYFTVKAGPYTLVKNFSASLFAAYEDSPAFFKEFIINVKENQSTIHLNFVAENSSFAFVNAIEVLSMPDNLYYPPTDDLSKRPFFIREDFNTPFAYYSDHALETLYRLNVGGRAISPTEDTGMFREWSQDGPYFPDVNWGARNPYNETIQLKYTNIPNYTAPDDVYKTAITMGDNAANNRARNLTWRFPVDRRFFYLVRLHFCQIQWQITAVSDMSFYVYIENRTAERNADVVMWTGGKGNGIPVYRDYVVYILDEDNLFIAIRANGDASSYDDAILNGIEVFKMSNGKKSLAGPNPPGNVSFQSRERGQVISGYQKRTVFPLFLSCSVLWWFLLY